MHNASYEHELTNLFPANNLLAKFISLTANSRGGQDLQYSTMGPVKVSPS